MRVRAHFHIGPIIAVELAAVLFALLLVAPSTIGRIGLAAAGAAAAALTTWWTRHDIRPGPPAIGEAAVDAIGGPSAGDAIGESAPIDAIGDAHGIVAVIALGDTSLITSTGTTLPRPMPASSDPDRPAVRSQLVVAAHPGGSTAYLAIRVGGDGIAWPPDALSAALDSTVRRVGRRLTAESIDHRRLTDRDLRSVTTPTSGHTLRVALRAGYMTEAAVVRATVPTGATLWLTWHHADLLVRVATDDPGAVATAATLLDELGTVSPVRRADRRLTAPLAWPIVDPVALPRYGTALRRRNDGVTAARSGSIDTGADDIRLALAADGIPLGFDRNGEAVFLRLERSTGNTDRSAPMRVVVAGTGAAARAIAAGARDRGVEVALGERNGGMEGGPTPAVPLILHVLAHPTSADTDALRSADLVVCQPLPGQEAECVARAVGLSPRMATWLAHAEAPMVALIGDGAVRWAMAATDRGLAGARQT